MIPDLYKQRWANRGFLFSEAPYLFWEVRQSSFPLAAWLESSTNVKGLDDRIRKRVERLGSEPPEKKIEKAFQQTMRDLKLDFSTNPIEEAKNLFPEEEAHAGAWTTIHSIARGVQAAESDPEMKQYMAFLLALADIDRQLLVTRSDEDAIYWSRRLGLSEILDSSSANQFHISTLLLWGSLAKLYVSILKNTDQLSGPGCFLRNSLPACKGKGELTLSSDAAIQYLKRCLPQLYKGTKATFTDLALAMKIDEMTVRRIRKGEALLRQNHLSNLLQQPVPLLDAIINIWTRRQKALLEAGMPAQEIIDCFSRYGESQKRVLDLFQEFKVSGTLCGPM